MTAYIVRRTLWIFVLLFMITLITFVVFSVLPSADPALLRAGRQPSPELVASIRRQFGLDDPLPVQFLRYVGQILPVVGAFGDKGSFLNIGKFPTCPAAAPSRTTTASLARATRRSCPGACSQPSRRSTHASCAAT